MKNLRSLRLLRTVALLFSIVLSVAVNAQSMTAKYVSMISNSNGYYEYLPQGYNSGSQSYPLLIFIHGVGELGDGSSSALPNVLKNGTPWLISQNMFPTSFTVNGTTTSFIMIFPQFVNWPGPGDIDAVINYAVQHYRVNTSKIYVTGLSMGGGATWEYAGNNSGYANRVAAIAPVCGASWPDPGRARIMAAANLPVWALHNQNDPTVSVSNTTGYVSNINQAPAPNPMARQTIFNASGHNAWSQAYDPNYRENGKNVYEWMLQYSRSGSLSSSSSSTTTTTTTPTPTPVTTTNPAPVYASLPAKIEAESFASMSGVQKESTSDAGGGQDVGYVDPGDWMDYAVNASTAGTYTITFRVATTSSNAKFDVRKADGTVLTTVSVPNTGGYQNWQTVNATVTLPQGQQTLRLYSTSLTYNSWNINWLQFTSGSSASSGSSSSASTTTASGAVRLEAENFIAMSGVQKESTSDAGGGQDVSYIDPNDWMDYTVNVAAAGTYNVSFRIASVSSNAKFDVRKSDGTVLASVTVPNTGGYQNWQTVTAKLTLAQGSNAIRLFSTSGQWNNWNVNWMDFALSSGTVSVSTSTTVSTASSTFRVEAETWSGMSGVQTESTSDAGGGKDVSYIDPNDWMDYSINAPTSGTYTVSFRVASQSANAKFDLRKSDGTVLATITVPNTGGWQSWQTVTANVTLPQGQQTLRLYSDAAQYNNWNINWMDFTTPVLSSLSANTNSTTTDASLNVSPNPVTDKFILTVNNNYTGDMDVQILDASGAIKKDFALTKSNTGASQTYLSIGDLAAGNYTVKVNMAQWNASASLNKQ